MFTNAQTRLEACILAQLPFNVYTRQLELPCLVPALNELSLSLQLHNFATLEKIETINRQMYDSNTTCESPCHSASVCSKTGGDQFGFFQAATHACKAKIGEFANLAEYRADQLSVFDETRSAFKIVISSDNSHSDNRSEVERTNYDLTKDFAASKSEIVNQYPHSIVTKWNEKLNRSQKLFVCKYGNCDKEFTKSWNLVYHARIHTNEKPFNCTECLESFAQKGNLKRHMKTHSETALNGRKKFQCKTCLKKYTTKFNLKVHRQTKHQD